jgi:hypothetical protein
MKHLSHWLVVLPAALLATPVVSAQSHTLQIFEEFGMPFVEDLANSVATDGIGNAYVVGSTRGSLAGAHLGQFDAYVAKYDGGGNALWSNQFGTIGFDNATAVATDFLGAVYVGGVTTGDLGDLHAGGEDAYLRKYDAQGTLLWTEQFGTSLNDEVTELSTDGSGNLYAAVRWGHPVAQVAGDASHVRKYDADGTLQWTFELPPDRFGELPGIEAVETDSQGNIYVAGYDYDKIFVSKYDADRNAVWTRRLGGTLGAESSPIPRAIAVDSSGSVIVGGHNIIPGNTQAWVAQYSSSGNRVWADVFDFPTGFSWANDAVYDVETDEAGNIYVAGQWQEVVAGEQFQPGYAFVRKYDPAGDVLWTWQHDKPSLPITYDVATGVAADPLGNVFISGHLADPVARNNRDAFLARFDASLPLGADFNGNGAVEQADLDLVLLHWGQSGEAASQEWINFRPSGIVDQAALDAVLLNWGKTGPLRGAPSQFSSSTEGVPEPTAIVLGTVAAILGFCVYGRPNCSRKDRRAMKPVLTHRIWLLAALLHLTLAPLIHAAEFFGLGDVIGGPGLSAERLSSFESLSRDGSTVVGAIRQSTPSGFAGIDVFRWRRNTGMVGLGFPGVRPAVNHDGSTILNHDLGQLGEFTLWTENGGPQHLGPLGPGGPFAGSVVRTNGTHFFGSTFLRNNPMNASFWYRWTEATGLEPVRTGSIQDMSLNGIGVGGSADGHAVIWTEEAGEQPLISESHYSSGANRISDDGSVIIGTTSQVEGGPSSLFRWTEAEGVQRLGPITDLTLPTMSRDGSAIFYIDENRNFRWKDGVVIELVIPETIGGGPSATRLESLPTLAVPSHDGSTLTGIVGFTTKVIWREGRGVMSLEGMLVEDFGLADSLAGWDLNRHMGSSTRTHISDDGLVLAGSATNPVGATESFVIYLDPNGDYSANAIVDQADLDLALLNWGQPGADAPQEWINFRPGGIVDQAALDGVLLNWGKTGPLFGAPPLFAGIASPAVPEPATITIGLLAAACAIASRRIWRSRSPLLRLASLRES